MYTLLNDYNILEENDCKSCENNSICKWCQEKTRIDNEVKNIEKQPFSPITVISKCKNYKRETKTNSYSVFR